MNTTSKDHIVKIVAEVKFMSITSKDQDARAVAEVKFVSTTPKDQSAPHAIPLDTLLGLYEAVFILL